MTVLTVFIDFKTNGVCIRRFNQVQGKNFIFALKGDFFDILANNIKLLSLEYVFMNFDSAWFYAKQSKINL